MALHPCKECGKDVSDHAHACPHCGFSATTNVQHLNASETSATGAFFDFSGSIRKIEQSNVTIKNRKISRLFWFILANAALVLSVSLISDGDLVRFTPFILFISCLFPFLVLWSSKWLAKRSHGIVLIDKNTPDPNAQALFGIVESLARKAGLRQTPEVGIYPSSEMNAFATGPSRNKSLVAFSTGLIESLDERSIAAVAAHEISHIANGDMVTMALVQSVVNSIINLITIPLSIVKIIALFDENVSAATYYLISTIKFVLTVLLVFFGSLVVKAFSRRREFKADALAAKLLDKDSMILALQSLSHDTVKVLKKQEAFAAFKINSPKRFMDIFSTHPSIERRIQTLQKLTAHFQ